MLSSGSPLRCLWGPNRVSAIHFGPSLPNIFPVRQLIPFLLPTDPPPPPAVVNHGHRKEHARPEGCQLVQHCCWSVYAPVAELFTRNSYAPSHAGAIMNMVKGISLPKYISLTAVLWWP